MGCESCKRIKSSSSSDLASLHTHYSAREAEEHARMIAAFENLPTPVNRESRFPAEKNITKKRLAIFEFDNVLFRTPKRPDWWPFEGYQTMMQSILPPTIPDTPGQEWWNQEIISEVKQAIDDPDTMAVLVTFRSDAFDGKLRALLGSVDIHFDEIKLRQNRPFLSALGRTSAAESGFGQLRHNLKAAPQAAEDNHTLAVLGALVERCTAEAIEVKVWANGGEEGEEEAGEERMAGRLAALLTSTDKCKVEVRPVKSAPMKAGRPTDEELEKMRAAMRAIEEERARRAEAAWMRKEEERLERARRRKEEERSKSAQDKAAVDVEEQRQRLRRLQTMPSAVAWCPTASVETWRPRCKQHPLTRRPISSAQRRRLQKEQEAKKRQQLYEWKVRMGYIFPKSPEEAQTHQKPREGDGHKQKAPRRALGRQFPSEVNYVAGKQFSRVSLNKMLNEQSSSTFRRIDEEDDYLFGSEEEEEEWDWEAEAQEGEDEAEERWDEEGEDEEDEGWAEDGSTASMYSMGSRESVGEEYARVGREDWESSSWVSSMGVESEGWSEVADFEGLSGVDGDTGAGEQELLSQKTASSVRTGYLSAILKPGVDGGSKGTTRMDSPEPMPAFQSVGRQRSRSLGDVKGADRKSVV